VDRLHTKGESKFKTEMPPNVIDRGLSSYIGSFKDVVFIEQQLRTIEEKIKKLKKTPASSKREHIEKLVDRFKSDTTCPKCGSELIKRTARQGQNTGQTFLGYIIRSIRTLNPVLSERLYDDPRSAVSTL